MTEPIFKAPLPPKEGGFTPPPPSVDKQPIAKQSQDLKQKILPYLWYVLGGTFSIGLIFGAMMSGGDSAPAAPECPLKYVRNPDVQKAYPLCGRTSKTNECLLFIMNTTRYDAFAEDFYETAAQLTAAKCVFHCNADSFHNVFSNIRKRAGLSACFVMGTSGP